MVGLLALSTRLAGGGVSRLFFFGVLVEERRRPESRRPIGLELRSVHFYYYDRYEHILIV